MRTRKLKLPLAITAVIVWAISVSCTSVPSDLPTGQMAVQFGHDNYIRNVTFHIPKRIKKKRRSMVLVLHAGDGTSRNISNITRREFNKLSDQGNFIVGYPEALNRVWNDGRNDSISLSHYDNVDDVGFINRIIDFGLDSFRVDIDRIFLAGYSNGGLMTMRMACESPGRIRGYAVVAAALTLDQLIECTPDTTSSMLIINGTRDPILPFEGGQITVDGMEQGSVLSAEETVNFWTREHKCTAKPIHRDMPNTDRFDETRSEKTTYPNCANGNKVILITVNNGGHTWPGGRQYLSEKEIGKTARDFDASDEIWKFFKNL